MPTASRESTSDRYPGHPRVSSKVLVAVVTAVPTVLSVLAWLLAPTLAAPDWTPFVRVMAFVTFLVALGLGTAYAIGSYRRRR